MKTKMLTTVILLLIAAYSFAFMPSENGKDQPLTQALYKTNIKIIDIRTEPEWAQTGVVKDSYMITFFDERGNYNVKKFTKKLDKIVNKDEPFALICRTGNRTSTVVRLLRQLGYSKVIDLKGGVFKAADNGIPFVKYK